MADAPAPQQLDVLTRLAEQARLSSAGDDPAAWRRALGGILKSLAALEAEAAPAPGTPPAAQAADASPAEAAIWGAGHRGTRTLGLGALRADEATPSLPVEVALANAPARLGDGFAVPPVLAVGRRR